MYRLCPARAVLAATAVILVALAAGGCGRSSGGSVDRALADGRTEDAWNLALEAVRADSSSAAAQLSLARAALATMRTRAGVDAANRAVELSGGDPRAYVMRAYLDQRRYRNLAALAAADSARERAPDGLACVRAAGEMRLGGGIVGIPDYDGAEAAFRKALSLDSTDVRSRFGLGKTLVLAGRESDSAPWIESVLQQYPAWGEAYYLRGLVRLRERDFEAAARDFESSVRFEPTLSAAWFNLARALDRLGRRDEAQEARTRVPAAKALEERLRTLGAAWHDSESPVEGLLLAQSLREAGQWEEAWQLAATLAIEFPRRPPVHMELAASALAAGHPEAAWPAAERACVLAPGKQEARVLAAHTAEAAGRPEDGLGHAREAVALDPDDPVAAALLAHLLVIVGDPTAALEPLNEVARRGVRDVRVAAARVEAWVALGRNDEAETLIRRVLATETRPQWLELRAKALLARGRWSWAQDDLRKALELDPGQVETWRELADLLEDADQPDEARECRERAATVESANREGREALEEWRASPYERETARRSIERLLAVERYADAGRITRISIGFGERP